MPQSTYRYPLEWKILRGLANMSELLANHADQAMFIVFTENGLTKKIILGDRPRHLDHNDLEGAKREASSWLFYHPFDAPEYIYVQWQNVELATMERLIRAGFEPNDFVSNVGVISFPSSWSVMF